MSSCNVAFNAKWMKIFHNLFIKMRCRDVVFTNKTVGFVCLDNQFNSFKYPNRRFLMTMLNPCRLNWNFLLSSIFKWKLQISFFGTKCIRSLFHTLYCLPFFSLLCTHPTHFLLLVNSLSSFVNWIVLSVYVQCTRNLYLWQANKSHCLNFI